MARLIDFGKEPTYRFKDIVIDGGMGFPILAGEEKEIVGGISIYKSGNPSFRLCSIEGIEIIPEYRGQGLGTALVRQIQKESDVIIGGIDTDCLGFWESVGAVIYKMPREYLPDRPNWNYEKMYAFYIAPKEEHKEIMEKMLCKHKIKTT